MSEGSPAAKRRGADDGAGRGADGALVSDIDIDRQPRFCGTARALRLWRLTHVRWWPLVRASPCSPEDRWWRPQLSDDAGRPMPALRPQVSDPPGGLFSTSRAGLALKKLAWQLASLFGEFPHGPKIGNRFASAGSCGGPGRQTHGPLMLLS